MSREYEIVESLYREGDINLSPERRHWQRDWLDRDAEFVLQEDSRYFVAQSLSTPCLDVLAGCRGSYLIDTQGRRFLDFHGNCAHQVGYGHPRVIEAINRQLGELSFCPRRFTNGPAVDLARKLVELAPGRLNKVLLTPGGTTAVGLALKMARVATGRFKTISMWDSFHGASLDALSVGGESMFRAGLGPLLPGTEHVPPADPSHCWWNPSGDCVACDLRCARYIEYVLEKEGDVGAVIAEPMRCTTINIPPPGYWPAVRKACERHGALLIMDETPLCLGRTGRVFACENFGVEPDILILGKGLGGGVFPLAATLVRDDLVLPPEMSLGHYTHEKNPVACAAALAAIQVMEDEELPRKAGELGQEGLQMLGELKKKYPCVGEVRGMGLVLGLELVEDRGSGPAVRVLAEKVMYQALSRGLNFKLSAGHFITLTPPLTITRDELTRAVAILGESLEAVS
jgi:4-aminobutyrate aminotransferase